MRVGDVRMICDDLQMLKTMQDAAHGGWCDDMTNVSRFILNF